MPIVPTTTNTQPAADPLELDSAKTWVLEKLNMLKSENNRHSVDRARYKKNKRKCPPHQSMVKSVTKEPVSVTPVPVPGVRVIV